MAVNTRTAGSAHSLPIADDVILQSATPRERLQRAGGWLTLLLAMVMLIAVAASVEGAGWTDGLSAVQGAVLGGMAVAFLLSLTRWSSGFAVFYSFLASIPWITTTLVRSLLQTPNLHDGIVQLGQHYAEWFNTVQNGAASGDNWVFVIQLCLLGWWIAYFAVWTLFRHQRAWVAVLPAGIGIVVNAYYAPQDVRGYVVVFLIAVLLLAVRTELARNEARWQMAHIRYAPDMYLDFLKEGLIFAVIVVVAAWMLPGISTSGTKIDDVIQPLRQPWQQVQDNWQRMFSSLKYKQNAYASTYGKSLKLGGPVSLTDKPIFQAQSPVHNYWRGATYDTYTGQQWLNTDQQVVSVAQGARVAEPIFQMAGAITTTIRTLQDGQDVLFAAPSPLVPSLAVNADVTPIGDPNAKDRQVVVSLLRSKADLKKDSLYQVMSVVSLAPPDLLRADNTNYPGWIQQRYLQVPKELPQRVRDLAVQVAGTAQNPYDKASMIEAFLRTYPYNTQIAAPPEGMDGVDYFLFDVKQGYCDYYASAMVIMLRSMGVPARFIAGYAPGEYDQGTNSYIITEENAHAWVEVFFPTYGWVQFEPTASQPVLARPTAAPKAPAAGAPSAPQTNPQDDLNDILQQKKQRPGAIGGPLAVQRGPLDWLQSHVVVIGVVLMVVLLAAVAATWTWRRNRQILAIDSGLPVRLFALLADWAGRLRIPWPASQTPLEHAHAFSQALPEAGEPINRLTGLLVAQQYGRQEPPSETLQGVAGEWQQLRSKLWKRWAQQYVTLPRWAQRFVRRSAKA